MSIDRHANNMNKLCRLCGGVDAIIHIFSSNGSSTLSDQAMSCAQIQIKRGDGLPEMVCEKCSSQVSICYLFKLQCEDSDKSFRSLLSCKMNNVFVETSSKLSFQLKLEDASDNEDEKKNLSKIAMEDCMQPYTPLMDVDHYSSNDESYLISYKRTNIIDSKCATNDDIKVESYAENVSSVCNQKSPEDRCEKSNDKTNSNNKKSDEFSQADVSHISKNAPIKRAKLKAQVNICNHETVSNDDCDDKMSTLCHICGQKYIPNKNFISFKNQKAQNNVFNIQSRKINSAKWTGIKKKTKDITNRRFMCDVCGLIYRGRSILLQHKNTHNAMKMYNCNLCGKKFTRHSYVITHMRIHNNIKPYVCETCGKTFRKSSDLCRHKKVHSDVRNYACSICNRRFKRSGDITSHMRTHTGDKPYTCSKCNKVYSSHSSLGKHRKMHCNSKSKFTQNNDNDESKIDSTT